MDERKILALTAALVLWLMPKGAWAEHICRYVRVVSEPARTEDSAGVGMPTVGGVIPGGDAWANELSGWPGEARIFVGLDAFDIPDGATITQLTAYGADQRGDAMTFRLHYAFATS